MSDRPLYERYRSRLEALRDLPLNFDLERREEYTAANGWHIDDVQAELPPEPPGPPAPGGSWETARRVLNEYRFADPSIITGIFVPESPLEQRVMLLRGRAFGLTFWFGTRVGAVIDERREGEGGQQVWGFNYQTLEGHLERGQMEFTVIKWLATGQVAFRIHAFSQAGEIPNPLIRLGFRLLGRRVQLRFINGSVRRMRRLVAEELGHRPHDPAREAGPPVIRAGADRQAAEKVERLRDEEKGRPMRGIEPIKDAPIGGEDVSRWLTFTSFWGSISYLLACVSLIAGARRESVRLHTPTLALGYAMHVLAFTVGGSLLSAAGSVARGKSSTAQAEESIGGGTLERTWPLQAAGGAAGSVLPFAMAVASQGLASRITGRDALGEGAAVSWPVAGGAMVASSGLVALAVSRITAWVAEDAKSGAPGR